MFWLPLLVLADPILPDLAWRERSDWVNVRTDPPLKARGDGQADDTLALQAALDAVVDGSVVYFPPGTYRLTSTLKLTGPKIGVTLIGHGRNTRIVWDGPEDGRMFWSDGIAYSRYVGLLWDGAQRAGVGFHHSAQVRFETEARHEFEAFVDCREAGLKLGGGTQQQASAEILYLNCLFARCGIGAAILGFNYYDNTFDRCEFRDCGQAIRDEHGNFYARNTHFAGSREVDLHVASEHGSSVRRCTSNGSRQFVRQVGSVVPLTVESCAVGSWTSPDGAMVLAGPTATVIDTRFTGPPDDAPPIANQLGRPLVLVNVTAPECRGLVRAEGDEVTTITLDGVAPGAPAPDHSFFRSTAPVPGRVFDAVTEFGAKGDGTTDDTAAVQAAVDAARRHGAGAIAYLPTGRYVLTRTLELTGTDYRLGGTGFRCGLLWRGPADQPIVHVRDPDGVAIEHLAIGNHDLGPMTATADILQTSSGAPSRMRYDNVYVFGMYQKQPDTRGLRLDRLGRECVVDIGHLQGNLTADDCGAATVLLRTSYEGTITVQGRGRERDGLFGVMTRLTTQCTEPLRLRDSHSMVASDWYVEQADRHVRLSGSPADPPGRLTFSGAKIHLFGPEPLLGLDGYRGSVVIAGDQFYIEPKEVRIDARGALDSELLLWGNVFYGTRLLPAEHRGLRLWGLANAAAGDGQVPGLIEPATALIRAACADWRRLGEVADRLDDR